MCLSARYLATHRKRNDPSQAIVTAYTRIARQYFSHSEKACRLCPRHPEDGMSSSDAWRESWHGEIDLSRGLHVWRIGLRIPAGIAAKGAGWPYRRCDLRCRFDERGPVLPWQWRPTLR